MKIRLLLILCVLPFTLTAKVESDTLSVVDTEKLQEIEQLTGINFSENLEKYRSALSVRQVAEFFEFIEEKTYDSRNQSDTVVFNPQQMIVFEYINNVFNIPDSNLQLSCGGFLWNEVRHSPIFSTDVLKLMLLWYKQNQEFCLNEKTINEYIYCASYSPVMQEAHNKIVLYFKGQPQTWDNWERKEDLENRVSYFYEFNEYVSEMMIDYFKEKYGSESEKQSLSRFNKGKFRQ